MKLERGDDGLPKDGFDWIALKVIFQGSNDFLKSLDSSTQTDATLSCLLYFAEALDKIAC